MKKEEAQFLLIAFGIFIGTVGGIGFSNNLLHGSFLMALFFFIVLFIGTFIIVASEKISKWWERK